MTASVISTPIINPEDPQWWLGDIHGATSWARQHDPVHQYSPGNFALTRHRDVRAVSCDPSRFSSEFGALVDDPLHTNPNQPHSVLQMDPPRHSAFRSLISRSFTPRAVAAMEPRVRALTDEILSAAPRGVEIDLVDHLAVPLPLMMIADLLGMHHIERAQFRVWSDETIKAADGMDADIAVVMSFVHALQTEIDARRTCSHDDVLQRLVDADINGTALDAGELIVYCMTLLVAGNETTRNLISGGMLALAEHPKQRAWLAQHPQALPAAVEEMLRWVSPICAMSRHVMADVELSGTTVHKGDRVVLMYPSANRDEGVWGPTASSFDVTRAAPSPQLAFGFGEHLCLGAALARLEARVFFAAMLDRYPDYAITGTPDRVASTVVSGWSRIACVLE